MEAVVFKLCLAQLIVEQFEISLPLLLLQESVVETMAVIEQVIGRNECQQDEHKHDDGNGFIRLRLLHRATIIAQSVISREFLEELGVDAVIIAVELPLMEGECCHRTLIAHIEDNLIVGLHAVVEPLDLRRQQRGVTHRAQDIAPTRMLLAVMLV